MRTLLEEMLAQGWGNDYPQIGSFYCRIRRSQIENPRKDEEFEFARIKYPESTLDINEHLWIKVNLTEEQQKLWGIK